MVDTLVQTIERIDTTAQYRVEQELLADFRRVTGKTGLLFRIAEASVERPDGVVWDVVSPAVGGERVIHELVSEYKAHWTGAIAASSTRRCVVRIRLTTGVYCRRCSTHSSSARTTTRTSRSSRPVELLKRYVGSQARTFRLFIRPVRGRMKTLFDFHSRHS
jgi:hypothetical protein